uniref:RNA-binding protein 3-like n=1 Tax=Pristiophorus japonicus TaxID=55135 RepID=UPI00398E4C35
MGKVRGSWEDFIPPQTAVPWVPKEQRQPSWRKKKQFIGSLNSHTDEQTREEQFCKYRPIAEVRAGGALQVMNGKSTDGRQVHAEKKSGGGRGYGGGGYGGRRRGGSYGDNDRSGGYSGGGGYGGSRCDSGERDYSGGYKSQSGRYGSIYGGHSHRDYD